MKYFVVSDVHGFYNEMIEALNKAGFDENNPEHMLISCGDATDRGPDAKKVLEYFIRLHEAGKAILVLGNHEELMDDAIARGYFLTHDIHNRTVDTVNQLTCGQNSEFMWGDEALQYMPENKLWNDYFHRCIDYFETENYIFVHGWIPTSIRMVEVESLKDLPEIYKPTEDCYNPNWREEGDWREARWLNGMKMWSKGIIEPDKTIICGHWHTSWGHAYLHNDGKEWLSSIETFYIDPETGKQEPHTNFSPFIDEGIMAIDACTAMNKVVNCVVVED